MAGMTNAAISAQEVAGTTKETTNHCCNVNDATAICRHECTRVFADKLSREKD